MVAAAREAPPNEKPYELWLAIFLIALVCARLIANSLARIDLVFDEAQYWSWSRELDFGYFSKPPLLAWLIRGTTELCGNGEACIRTFPPIVLAVATWFVFLAGRALYGVRAGFWSAIVFNTLPLIASLAVAVTTDIPLLLFWSIALYLWTRLIETKRAACAVLLGLTIGVGLLAKYAMIYFPLCMACHAAVSAEARAALGARRVAMIAAAALLPIAPNLYWNYTHGFVTFQHTAGSAGWGRSGAHLRHFGQFVLSQFGVYGPVLFFMVLWIVGAALRGRAGPRAVMLLAFILPIVILITVQSLISRIHATWTAAIAPAAAILVTAWLLERGRKLLFWATIAINAVATAAMLFGPALPARLFPAGSDPFARTSGWKDLAAAVRRQLATGDYRAIVADGRDVTAELLYYLRDSTVPIFVLKTGEASYFETTRPYVAGTPEPALLVSLREQTGAAKEFKSVTYLGAETVPGGGPRGRTVRFWRLSGFGE